MTTVRLGRLFASALATPAGGCRFAFLAVGVVSASVAFGEPREIAVSEIMPRLGDVWVDTDKKQVRITWR